MTIKLPVTVESYVVGIGDGRPTTFWAVCSEGDGKVYIAGEIETEEEANQIASALNTDGLGLSLHDYHNFTTKIAYAVTGGEHGWEESPKQSLDAISKSVLKRFCTQPTTPVDTDELANKLADEFHKITGYNLWDTPDKKDAIYRAAKKVLSTHPLPNKELAREIAFNLTKRLEHDVDCKAASPQGMVTGAGTLNTNDCKCEIVAENAAAVLEILSRQVDVEKLRESINEIALRYKRKLGPHDRISPDEVRAIYREFARELFQLGRSI